MNPILLMFERLFGPRSPAAPLGPQGAAAGLSPSTLFDRINDLVMGFAQASAAQLIEQLWLVLHVLLPILLILNFAWMLYKGMWGLASGGSIFASFLISLLVYCLASDLELIHAYMVNGITAVSTMLSDAAGRALGNGSAPTDTAAFGAILNDALLMGVELWKSLGWDDILGAILVAGLFIAAVVSITDAWWMYFKGSLWLVVLAAIAPFALTCALVPATRGIFFRWVDTVWGFIVLKLVVIVFAQIFLGVEGQLVREILSTQSGVADKVILLLCAVLVFVAMFLMSRDIPRVAASIGGGVIMHGPSAVSGFAAGYATRAYAAHRQRVERDRERQEQVAARLRAANP